MQTTPLLAERRYSTLSSRARGGRPRVLFAALCWVLFVVVVSVWSPPLPPVRGTSNNDARFEGRTAYENLARLTEWRPHALGMRDLDGGVFSWIRDEAHAVAAESHTSQRVKVSVQVGSGVQQSVLGRTVAAFRSPQPIDAQAQVYTNVRNVVVRIGGVSDEHAVLLNAHCDSGDTSPGASDDGVGCVALLEVARALAAADSRLPHAVVLLFNFAEEQGLLGAHLFASQHEWAASVRAFWNLEGAGAGGREMVFQAGPDNGNLARMYAGAVPHPHGNVFAQDIYQGGVIPSDTDFSVLANPQLMDGVTGIDAAFYENGQVYHTPQDNFAHVSAGSVQHMGANALAFARAVAAVSPEAMDGAFRPGAAAPVVFFDAPFKTLVVYSASAAFIINGFVAACGLVAVVMWSLRTGGRRVVAGFVLYLGAVSGGMAAVVVVAGAMGLLKPMWWYALPRVTVAVMVPVFASGALAGMWAGEFAGGKVMASEEEEEEPVELTPAESARDAAYGALLFNTCLLSVCWMAGLGAAYLPMLLTVGGLVVVAADYAVLRVVPAETREKLGASLGDLKGEETGMFAALVCVGMSLPVWFAAGIAVALYRFLHGTLGRIVGPTSLIISAWCGISVVLVGAPTLVPLTRVLGVDRRKGSVWVSLLSAFCAWAVLASVAVALFSPQYTAEYAKRTQVSVVWSDEDSHTGAYMCVRGFDAISPMHVASEVFPTLAWTADEEAVSLCEGDSRVFGNVVAAPVSQPDTPYRPGLAVVADDVLADGRRNVTVRFSHEGTFYGKLALQFPGVDEWSLDGAVPVYEAGIGLSFMGGGRNEDHALPLATEHTFWFAGHLPADASIWGTSILDRTARSGARPEDAAPYTCDVIARWMSGLPSYANAPLRTSCEPSVQISI